MPLRDTTSKSTLIEVISPTVPGKRSLMRILVAPVLEQEQKEVIPDDALKDDHLDHENADRLAKKFFKEGDADNECVREGRQGEEGDGPLGKRPPPMGLAETIMDHTPRARRMTTIWRVSAAMNL
ncbi:hypothetical protein CDL15_Pgr018198 [Punica granatum]|uniref:Uncharacterized protein n=1 Tax=Punica granatum TaxID=22663 RepID=A0A218WIB5_PUNGR|nr:hypothetical protein CDL15_Pgr018198 [Punica granatum]PKI55462.1 hypothetical protein CRG98_024074 [Punica granatum]